MNSEYRIPFIYYEYERLQGFTVNEKPTLAGIMLFSDYPQAFFPQLCITAVSVPGTEISPFPAVTPCISVNGEPTNHSSTSHSSTVLLSLEIFTPIL